jgi:RNA polymerase sigma-70 factor (ECF subfamily)
MVSNIFRVFLTDKEYLTVQSADPGEVTLLLQQIGHGDSHAVDRLIPLVLQELRKLARSQLRNERSDHTLQPTALVNEAYIRLVSDQARDWQSRAHFIGVSASVMRRILVDHARRRRALRRGGFSRSAADIEHCAAVSDQRAEELLTLNSALDRLEEMSPRQRRVVELRYFGGLSPEETAEVLNVSPITVKRDWLVAKAWLKGQLRHQPVG